MSDESYSFTAAKARLEEIVDQVRKKDTSLEKSLDLLEEGVRLANACTEMIDSAEKAPASAGVTGGEDTEAESVLPVQPGLAEAVPTSEDAPIPEAEGRGSEELGEDFADAESAWADDDAPEDLDDEDERA